MGWIGVNASGLKSAVNNALSDLGSYSLNSEVSSLSVSGTVSTTIKSKVVGDLNKISNSTGISGSISVLRSNLNYLGSAADSISQYQQLQKEIDALEPYRTKEETRTGVYYDQYGNRCEYDYTETVDDWDVINQINNKKSQQSSLDGKINSYLSNIR